MKELIIKVELVRQRQSVNGTAAEQGRQGAFELLSAQLGWMDRSGGLDSGEIYKTLKYRRQVFNA